MQQVLELSEFKNKLVDAVIAKNVGATRTKVLLVRARLLTYKAILKYRVMIGEELKYEGYELKTAIDIYNDLDIGD